MSAWESEDVDSAGWRSAPEPLNSNDWGRGSSRRGEEPKTQLQLVSAPWPWLATGLLMVAVSLIGWLLFNGMVWSIAGWALAGPLGIGMWALFLVNDVRRRATGMYVRSGMASVLSVVLVLAALVVCALHAYAVADLVARLG